MTVREHETHDTTGCLPTMARTCRRRAGSLTTAACTVFALVSLGARPRAAIGGELLVSGFFSDRVERYDDTSGTHLGSLDVAAGLDGPLCARLGPDGLLYVASEGTDSVVRFDPLTGLKIDTFITPGAGGLDAPTGLTWDPTGRLYVSAFNSDSILRFNADGSFDSVFIASGSGGLNGPDNGSTFGPDGNLYVPSYYSNRILRYDGATGAFLGAFGGFISRPRVLVFQGSHLLVSSETANSVRRHDAATGAFIDNFVAAGAGGLKTPVGLAFGPDGDLYVASSATDQVLRYDGVTGAFQGVAVQAGAGGLDGPVFLTFVPSLGTLSVGTLGVAMMGGRRRRRSA